MSSQLPPADGEPEVRIYVPHDGRNPLPPQSENDPVITYEPDEV